MKRLYFLSIIFLSSFQLFASQVQIINSGFTFSSNAVIINNVDSVDFVLASMHNAVEVSKATWDANGNTPLQGGFQVSFGGGWVLPAQLSVGIHYYVCAPHASLGMKGTITVQAATFVPNLQSNTEYKAFTNSNATFVTLKVPENAIHSNYILLNVLGTVITKDIVLNESTDITIDELTTGIYFIVVTDNKKSKVIRFYKK
jgi:plastocyanin